VLAVCVVNLELLQAKGRKRRDSHWVDRPLDKHWEVKSETGNGRFPSQLGIFRPSVKKHSHRLQSDCGQTRESVKVNEQ